MYFEELKPTEVWAHRREPDRKAIFCVEPKEISRMECINLPIFHFMDSVNLFSSRRNNTWHFLKMYLFSECNDILNQEGSGVPFETDVIFGSFKLKKDKAYTSQQRLLNLSVCKTQLTKWNWKQTDQLTNNSISHDLLRGNITEVGIRETACRVRSELKPFHYLLEYQLLLKQIKTLSYFEQLEQVFLVEAGGREAGTVYPVRHSVEQKSWVEPFLWYAVCPFCRIFLQPEQETRTAVAGTEGSILLMPEDATAGWKPDDSCGAKKNTTEKT